MTELPSCTRSAHASGHGRFTAYLATHQPAVDTALEEMARDRVIARIWSHDHTVWKPSPIEITNRLGWLHCAEAMQPQIPDLRAFAESITAAGYTDVLVLGMGGSSLAPEVLAKVFGPESSGLRVAVLDTTDPGAILAHAQHLDLIRTLFVVSTKSGGTVETLSAFKYFYNQTASAVGTGDAGQHFVAITDPGSSLTDLAARTHFRRLFLNDPNIGGRYSALSLFGLLPAALAGVDLGELLSRAVGMARWCEAAISPDMEDNVAARLGAILGELAKAGRDKLTLVISEPIASLGDWIEQLVAESTGKEGRGILPVVGEPLRPPLYYGNDRLFVHLRLDGHDSYDAALEALQRAGFPVVRLCLRDRYDLGEQFFLWEMATAVAAYRLGINPFDQPDVEAAKVLARRMVAAYTATGQLPADEPAPLTAAALHAFLAQAQPGDYIALQAYLQPSAETDAALRALRSRLRDQLRLATTVGYGPRFLHSTGQLHKGDAGHGLFIQFTADDPRDVPIPDKAASPSSSITFGVLKLSQALGDRQALIEAGRRVIRFHLGNDRIAGLTKLTEGIA
jgi:glucose-6-phosphate isomerase